MASCCIAHAKCGAMNFHTRLSALVACTPMMTWIYQNLSIKVKVEAQIKNSATHDFDQM